MRRPAKYLPQWDQEDVRQPAPPGWRWESFWNCPGGSDDELSEPYSSWELVPETDAEEGAVSSSPHTPSLGMRDEAYELGSSPLPLPPGTSPVQMYPAEYEADEFIERIMAWVGERDDRRSARARDRGGHRG